MSKNRAGRIISYSFLIVAAIHIIAFTVVGVLYCRWSLLIIFVATLAVTILVKLLVTYLRNKKSNQNL